MKAPESMTSFSHNGKVYNVDKDGHVEVPDGAIADLSPHGLVPAPVQVESVPDAAASAPDTQQPEDTGQQPSNEEDEDTGQQPSNEDEDKAPNAAPAAAASARSSARPRLRAGK
jgi:hypothetical protein